mgnify:CR=1 FL=1
MAKWVISGTRVMSIDVGMEFEVVADTEEAAKEIFEARRNENDYGVETPEWKPWLDTIRGDLFEPYYFEDWQFEAIEEKTS